MSGKLSADERLELWRDWLDGLKKEIGDRHVERGIWREMTDALDAKLPHSVAFRNHYARLYVDAQAMAIRRLTDKDHRVQSVARLLIEIRLHRDVMTRSRFIGLRPSDEAARSGVMFDREFGLGSDHVADETLARDLDELAKTSEAVRHLANKRVAHMTGTRPRQMTFEDRHTSLDVISKIFTRYYRLLNQVDLDPVPSLADDWRRPFRGSLFPEFPFARDED